MQNAALVRLGSMQTFAAFAHRKNSIVALNFRFIQAVQFSLLAQRMPAIRPSHHPCLMENPHILYKYRGRQNNPQK
jgi:hypothetical protein